MNPICLVMIPQRNLPPKAQYKQRATRLHPHSKRTAGTQSVGLPRVVSPSLCLRKFQIQIYLLNIEKQRELNFKRKQRYFLAQLL